MTRSRCWREDKIKTQNGKPYVPINIFIETKFGWTFFPNDFVVVVFFFLFFEMWNNLYFCGITKAQKKTEYACTTWYLNKKIVRNRGPWIRNYLPNRTATSLLQQQHIDTIKFILCVVIFPLQNMCNKNRN